MKTLHRAVLGAAASIVLAGTMASGQVPPTSSDWATKTVPLEVLAQFPMITQPRMSPDGKWIATRIRAGGEQVLAIVPVKPGEAKTEVIARNGEAIKDKEGDRQIVDYRWADSDHLVITFDTRENFYGQWIDDVRYASYNRTTKKILPLGWDKSLGSTEMLWLSNSGKPHMLLQRIPWDANSTPTRHAVQTPR